MTVIRKNVLNIPTRLEVLSKMYQGFLFWRNDDKYQIKFTVNKALWKKVYKLKRSLIICFEREILSIEKY